MQGMASTTREYSKLPPPWDRIFSLGTRTFVWAVFLAVLYILRPFFLTVFLTFLFAYIQDHGVHRLAGRIPNRPARVVVVFMVLLGILGGLADTSFRQMTVLLNSSCSPICL